MRMPLKVQRRVQAARPPARRLPLLLFAGWCVLTPSFAESPAAAPAPTVESATAEMNQAIKQVQAIVNQPVTQVPFTRDMEAGHYPYWFHPGAIKPDYNHVDVRKTQEFPYDRFSYVYSDLNPNVAFIGPQLEFNSMTKYFYTDRSVPKKKLSEPEMVEINRLYRIIGRCEQQLAEAKADAALTGPARLFRGLTRRYPWLAGKENYILAVIGLILLLLFIRWYRKQESE